MTVINGNGKWILRVARFSDFQAISSFHSQGTFESLDYMPVTYHKLLQDKNSNAFVATTCDGKVIGFVNYFLVEKAKVAVSLGVRVHDEHQKQGLMGWMCNEALKCITLKYPEVCREAWCSQYLPYLEKKLNDPESTLIADKESVWLIYKVTHQEVEAFSQNANRPNDAMSLSQSHRQLSLQETKELLVDPTILEELFPENVFLVGVEWIPMKKTISNLMYAAAQSHTYGSFDNNSGRCLGITFCFSSKSPYGSTHHFMFYGRQKNILLNHLYLHICHVGRITNEKEGVAFTFQFPVHSLEAIKQEVVDFLSPYLGEPRKSDTFSRQRALAVSKPIEKNS